MKIVLTGSAGRIGHTIAVQLLVDGHQITGIDLAPARIEHAHYHHVQCRFEQAETLNDAVKGADVLLHIGAMMSWQPKDNAAMFHANVTATQWLLDAARAAGVKRFVFASSGEVYPEVRAQFQPVTEDHPRNPVSFYGLTKKLAEDLVLFYQQQGLETVILRFPHTQSIDELLDPESFFSGPRFFLDGKIRQMRSFGNDLVADKLQTVRDRQGGPAMIVQYGEDDNLPYQMHIADVRDTADGVILAMSHPQAANGIYNLGTDEPVAFEDMLPLMAQATGLPLIDIAMPGKAVRYKTSNQKIKRELGYQPRFTFPDMIAQAARLTANRHNAKESV
ncbi:NAD-dependent epimerase/dehydratase family protein [Lelliottia amnigena]|uniref:NAD-dependent epimerase/dehydratase family protein n=1 Tax=Lelliottia amnigena TaxID=61646 RepID=UPI001F3FA5FF|nr:NAD(P)-dependent oxidoreductase [Lelliottia amnigena]MCE9964245.1 NAD(P)-dependent oxidoreductase [Lelliottia amnigena]